MTDLTTDEILEIEILSIEKWGKFKFTPMLLDKKNNEMLINDLDFEKLLRFTFPKNYTINDQTIAVDYSVFKILQLRYFKDNETVEILN